MNLSSGFPPMPERCVAVLGWRDQPTDGVKEYCQFLGDALARQGIQLDTLRVAWPEKGWKSALRDLRRETRDSRNTWYLLQYTALGWSRRGFPLRILNVLRELNKNGGRCAVVFHDVASYPGNRLIDRLRGIVQLQTMRRAMRLADLSIVTVAKEKLSWIPKDARNVTFIPVGANLPHPENAWFVEKRTATEKETLTVAVFSISVSSAAFVGEGVKRVAAALRHATAELGSLKLAVLGHNSEIAGQQLQEALAGTPTQIVIHGLLKSEDIVRILGASDVLLFVGGPISTRRGSAIAGIACGLPVVAREGWETAFPITEAGVELIPETPDAEFGAALLRVLRDHDYRATLREKSRKAQELYFSWDAIAAKYASLLRTSGED